MIAIALAFAALGAGLLVFGLRGRRIDDHPLCGRCGFDLVGSTPAPVRCPECGVYFYGDASLRVGNRRRRPWAAATGGVIVGAAALVGGGSVVSARFDWTAYAPNDALIVHARLAGERSAAASLEELRERAANGELSEGRIERLIDEALALQADESRPWKRGYGDFLVWALEDARLSEKEIYRFFDEYVSVHVWAPRKLRAGSELRVDASFDFSIERAPSRMIDLRARVSLERIVLASRPEQAVTPGMRRVRTNGGALLPAHYGAIPEDLRIGSEQRIVTTVRYALHGYGARPPSAEPLLVITRDIENTFEVYPPDAEFVERVADPEIDEVVRSAIKVGRERREGAPEFRLRSSRSIRVVREIPVAVSFDLELVQGGEVAARGRGVANGPSDEISSLNFFMFDSGPDLSAGPAELVMRTNPRHLEGWSFRPLPERVWDGTIRREVYIPR